MTHVPQTQHSHPHGIPTPHNREDKDICTLVDMLERHAAGNEGKDILIFLQDGGKETDRRSYPKLARNARAIATRLQRQGHAGGTAVLFYPQGLDFVDAFFGVLYAGGIPVPAFAPDAHRDNFERLEKIVADSQARVLLTDRASASILMTWAVESAVLTALQIIETDNIVDASCEWHYPQIAGGDVAFIQYTSGSTSLPKGVLVTHENLLANVRMHAVCYRQDAKSVFVMWVPLYHDLGLISNVLFALFIGAQCIVMAPETFIRNPLNWLNAVSRYEATISFAPTFAYEYSMRCIKNLPAENADFRNWRAVIGAEPIHKDTIERFAAALSPFGFDRRNFQCAYGLAESTVIIVTTPYDAGPVYMRVDAQALSHGEVRPKSSDQAGDFHWVVSSGYPGPGHQILIVDLKTNAQLPERRVGEIYLAGPSIAKGYFRDWELSSEVFGNRLDGESTVKYLRSGDLGFLHDGQLYVTGRIKDMIIVNGANHYPQDIELTVCNSDSSIRVGCAAAFVYHDGKHERLVIAAELRKEFSAFSEDAAIALIKRILGEIWRVHRLAIYDVILLRAGDLSKTSSGKLQRQLMSLRYERRALRPVMQLRSP